MSDFTPADLPRVAERIPYLYLEQCVIKRMNNALVAADENGETQLPIATIAVLMLGPGTTITHDSVVLASDTGAIIVWAGEQGVRHYCSGSALTGSTRLLEQQARLVSNERSRLMVARRMYAMRFPAKICPIRRCANCSAWKAPESQPCTRLRRSATTYNGTAGNGMTVAER